MKRILVIGCGGAGKTTLAKKLGDSLGLPVIHLDAHFWQSGWKAMSSVKWKDKINTLLQEPAWIMDGNYGGTLEQRFLASDTVIFLDMARWRCLYNVVKRRIEYAGTNRPEMARGNKERLPWSFIYWIWSYRREKRPFIIGRLKELANEKCVVILHTPEEVESFLAAPLSFLGQQI